MAKKKAKAAKVADPAPATAADGGAVDPNDTGSNTAGGLGSMVSGAVSSLTSPFGDWMNSIEADVMNMTNQVFNSLFFGLAAAAGAGMMMWGVYLLFKNTEAGGIASAAGTAASFLAGPEIGAATVATKTVSKSKAPAKPKSELKPRNQTEREVHSDGGDTALYDHRKASKQQKEEDRDVASQRKSGEE